jgi:hypothetical protein
MTTSDIMRARGQVSPSFIDIRTGKMVPWPNRHNTISFDATRSMALAFGGDDSMIPNRIGIIYGSTENTSFANIGRQQSWDGLAYEMQENEADVQIQPFCYSPSFTQISRPSPTSPDATSSSIASSPESDSSNEDEKVSYPGWAVTFHAHSDSVTAGKFGTVGSGSSGSMIFTSGMYIFQGLLLNERSGKYTILARVSLDNSGTYYAKPDNFEIAIDWTIKFF